MRSILACVVLSSASLLAATVACAAPELKTDEEKTLYAIGMLMQRGLQPFALSEAEFELVKAGIVDSQKGRPAAVDPDALMPQVRSLQDSRTAAAAAKEKAAGAAYVQKAAGAKDVKKTASGALVTTKKEGTGAKPVATDQVKVNYEGRLLNGAVFDSSIKRGQPATFPLTRVIRCWTEALPLMKVGGKSEIVCPSDIAYGDRGSPPKIPPGATLVFDVELLEIVKEQAPAKEPAR